MQRGKSLMVGARLSGDARELFEACTDYLNEIKRKNGLLAETTHSEVIRHALACMDEKFGITAKKRQPKRAV